MAVKVFVDGKKRSMRVLPGSTIQQVVSCLGLNNNTVILKKNKVLAHPLEKLGKDDRLDVVNVIYGG